MTTMAQNRLQAFIGGAPRFDTGSTFLGRKMEANVRAMQPATPQAIFERVLGKSDRYSLARNTVEREQDTVDLRKAIPAGVKSQAAGYESALNTVPAYSSAGDVAMLESISAAPMPVVTPQHVDFPKIRWAPTSTQTSRPGNSIVGYAQSSTSDPGTYRYGVWDCSKFTQTVVKNSVGVQIGRDTAAQIGYFRKAGLFTTDMRHLRPGDILYFNSPTSPSGRHTGVYIGNGYMVDNSGGGVRVRSIAGRSLIGIGLASWLNGGAPAHNRQLTK